MNAKELIIGHFEGSLSPAEQGRLDHMLESSPEVRAQFDQQKMIEESMAEDSRSLVPPIGLREATIAAALGGGIATIGGGLGAWFTGKIAAIFGTVLVGGLVVGGVLIYDGDDEVVENTVPVVQVEDGSESIDAELPTSDVSIPGGVVEVGDGSPSTSESTHSEYPSSTDRAVSQGEPAEVNSMINNAGTQETSTTDDPDADLNIFNDGKPANVKSDTTVNVRNSDRQ